MPITTDEKAQLGMVTSPDDELQFSARHRPALRPGDFTVHVTQTLNIAGSVHSFQSETTKFAVFAPRFILREADIAAIFPPAQSTSQFAEVLPHIILNRPTLPWERTCEKGSSDANARPWLALLVFSESELVGAVKQVKVSDLLATAALGSARFASLVPESGDPTDDSATVIDLPWGVLTQVLPAVVPDETSLVCHVRSVKYASPASTMAGGQECSVVIANRLPPPGKRVMVHVVSLEDCYEGSPLKFLGGPPKDSETVRLISLYSWQFFCQTDAAGDFEARMNILKTNVSRLHLPTSNIQGAGTGKQQATTFLEGGFIPLRHRFRQGDASVSWYHGPLLPGESPAPSNLAAALPSICADKLLLYNSQQGMLDASYAAAWELGRMLMLENSLIAGGAFEFRRATAQAAIAKQHFDSQPDALYVLPPRPGPEIPSNVQDWIANRLALFQGVPFNYLVPDESYLPQESVRFFHIDQIWRECLIDGALSVGRFAGDTSAADSQLQANLPKASSGFLLRSAIVSDFPGLQIDAYPTIPTGGRAQPAQTLKMLRRVALSPNILLVIFDGVATVFDFHLSPESIHFGVDHPDAAGAIHKTLRQLASPAAVDVPFRSQTQPNVQKLQNVIDIRSLATRILQAKRGKAPNETDLPEFALEMIESVPVLPDATMIAPYLFVPLKMDALCLSDGGAVLDAYEAFNYLPRVDAEGDHNAASPYLSTTIDSTAFNDHNLFLPAGVHLHWALPPALSRGRAQQGSADVNSSRRQTAGSWFAVPAATRRAGPFQL